MLASMLWRRTDTPGHDACVLSESVAGFQLAGSAVFVHEALPAWLTYELSCDRAWCSRRGHVRGWIGTTAVDIEIIRSAEGVWSLNGAVVSGLEACFDLDLGFTPATNLSQIRRLALPEAGAASAPVAWLDIASGALSLLQQRYERRSLSTYWYEAPRFGYAALLDVSPAGFVRRYPGLWEEQARE